MKLISGLTLLFYAILPVLFRLKFLKKSNVRRLSNVRPQKTTFALNKLKNLNNLSVKAH